MSLESNISTIIQEKLKGDLIEKVVAEQLEKCIKNAVDDLFGGWGDCTKIVKDKVKEVMVPQLERYDYSEHVVKLDAVLTEILKATTLDNKKILENFKELMKTEDVPKEIKMSDIFNKYTEYVAKEVDTDELEVEYDEGVSYESVEATMEVEEESGREWSSFKWGKAFFECEKDENLNVEVSLSKYKNDDHWTISMKEDFKLSSLKRIDDFTIFLMKLDQNQTHIIMDAYEESDDVIPEKEPEASWS